MPAFKKTGLSIAKSVLDVNPKYLRKEDRKMVKGGGLSNPGSDDESTLTKVPMGSLWSDEIEQDADREGEALAALIQAEKDALKELETQISTSPADDGSKLGAVGGQLLIPSPSGSVPSQSGASSPIKSDASFHSDESPEINLSTDKSLVVTTPPEPVQQAKEVQSEETKSTDVDPGVKPDEIVPNPVQPQSQDPVKPNPDLKIAPKKRPPPTGPPFNPPKASGPGTIPRTDLSERALKRLQKEERRKARLQQGQDKVLHLGNSESTNEVAMIFDLSFLPAESHQVVINLITDGIVKSSGNVKYEVRFKTPLGEISPSKPKKLPLCPVGKNDKQVAVEQQKLILAQLQEQRLQKELAASINPPPATTKKVKLDPPKSVDPVQQAQSLRDDKVRKNIEVIRSEHFMKKMKKGFLLKSPLNMAPIKVKIGLKGMTEEKVQNLVDNWDGVDPDKLLRKCLRLRTDKDQILKLWTCAYPLTDH